MVTIAPSKDWWANWERYCTARNDSGCAAREFSLWIDGRLELCELPGQEIFDAGAEVCSAEGFDCLLEGPETPVISDVGVVAAET